MRIEERIRKDGTRAYRCVVRLAPYPPLIRTFGRRAEAVEWGTEQEARIRRERAGLSVAVSRATISELRPRYQATHHRRPDATSANRIRQLEWWGERFPRTPAAALRQGQIRRALDALEVAPATRNRYLAALSYLYRWAMEEELTDRNPCAGIRRASEAGHVIRYLTGEEREALLEQVRAEGPLLTAWVLLSLWTGGRLGEVHGLGWRDVDTVHSLVSYPSTKGGRPRLVPAPAEVMQALAQIDRGNGPEAPVFERWPRKAWERALEASGVQRFRWHDLRHSYASWLVQQGVPLADVQQLLGHRSITTTLRYAHLATSDTHERVRAALTRHAEPPVSPPVAGAGQPASQPEPSTPDATDEVGRLLPFARP